MIPSGLRQWHTSWRKLYQFLRGPNCLQVVLEAAGTSRRQFHENDDDNEDDDEDKDSGEDDETDDEEYEAT
ncbi:UNVERIFIED_CONTAM: hypothetical protein Sangu_2960200 [Sesamum angustifolium]|uniref:Uncharacterized protein n=1 Tax=Sesamum angustifolium TaxID=2727405 RepID=A0AAW2IJ28_9LAMI